MKKYSIFLFFLPLCIQEQSIEDSIFIKKLSDEILTNGKAYSYLHQLTKQIGGRLSGSPQFAKAVVWGKKSLQEVGADTVFLQSCKVPHWVRGGQDKASIIRLNNKITTIPLDVTALGNSQGSGKNGVTAPVIAVKNFDELEQKKELVKGKIVFYNYPFNPTNINPGKSYGAAGKYRWNGASRAAKYGAIAVIVRSLTEATDNNPHTGGMEYNDSFPKIPAVAIGIEDAEKLWQYCQQSSPVVQLNTFGKMLPDTIGHNVVAEIKGSSNPEQYITVGGHLDSWDINEGASDDGTGVVQTIEIARAFKALHYQPKHTIRFVLFANEENGSRGAEKYATEAKAHHETHLFALESDGGGFTPRGFSFTLEKEKWAKLLSWLPLLSPYGTEKFIPGEGGEDVGYINEAFGTPVAGLLPDPQRYFDVHHARSDVFEKVNKRELHLGAINMAALLYLVDKYGL